MSTHVQNRITRNPDELDNSNSTPCLSDRHKVEKSCPALFTCRLIITE